MGRDVTMTVNVELTGKDEALEAIEKLSEKMQEVKSLAEEVKSCISNLKLEVDI